MAPSKTRTQVLMARQGAAQQMLNKFAAHIDNVAAGKIVHSQTEWDRLFRAHKGLADVCSRIGDALKTEAVKAGATIDD